MPLVRELMSTRPTSVAQTATLGAALELLRELDVRHLPVVNESREVVGMLSDRDFARLRLDENLELAAPTAKVASVMSSDVVSATPEDELADAIDLMLEHRIGAVPVVNPEGRLVGILSYVDVLRGYQRELGASA